MAILDATFLVELRRGSPGAIQVLAELQGRSPLRVPAAVWAECLSWYPPLKRHRAVAELERTVVFEAFNRELADLAARLQHEMGREGQMFPWSDLQVAVTALYYGEPLVTNDRGFRKVPGLDVKPH